MGPLLLAFHAQYGMRLSRNWRQDWKLLPPVIFSWLLARLWTNLHTSFATQWCWYTQTTLLWQGSGISLRIGDWWTLAPPPWNKLDPLWSAALELKRCVQLRFCLYFVYSLPSAPIFVPRFILICSYKEPQPKKNPYHRPQTPST